ncbi:hypothetical protein HX871_18810 [Pseudomonas reactans]|uniref:Uncharacterized protein n=1 Tax=Pseudomonas reactans TaxID=117680 RepID=A0ABX2QXC8_9PSED|nr:hypothetical protein [Pseudomonas reactans]NWA41100.1 hypothetical protein [Pseudomonas reactans]NWD96479.1 hypothetical protein [Pseudomonas reactans]
MSKPKLPPESEVVTWLQRLIENDQLLENIQGQEIITSITDAIGQDFFIPSFGIDYISRRASAEAAGHVLGRLGLLKIISINTSISLTKGEVLRPDILCFSPESKTLVVFEVKRASETERQTVTELVGYEQELRNLLPFLGNFDICFVVVAADWSTLLTHAVGSMNAWSGKQCLALKLVSTECSFALQAHLPEAWHLTGSVRLPPEALPSIDLYLGEKSADAIDDEGDKNDGGQTEANGADERLPPRLVITAMDIIARAGDRAGSHGFMMLWRDVNGYGRGRWCITLCAIDPYSMYAWCKEHGLPQRDSEASLFLDSCKADIAGQTPSTIYDLANAAYPILKEHFEPEFSGDFCWQMKARQYRLRGVPTRFEFWGSLGQHAREFVCNPAVRNWYMPYMSQNQLDWTDPVVAMPLVENLSAGVPFQGGTIKCSDAFLVGRALGDLALAAFNAAPDKEHAARIEPMVEWAQLEALRYAIEMKQMYDVTEEIVTPIPRLSNDPSRRLQATEDLANWVRTDLISDRHPFHQACFDLGLREAMLFRLSEEGSINRFPPDRPHEAASLIRRILKGAILRMKGSQAQLLQSTEYRDFEEYLAPYLVSCVDAQGDVDGVRLDAVLDEIPGLKLLRAFPGTLVKGIDSIVPVVLHTVIPAFPMTVDWEWLKSGVRALFEAGDHRPAVIFNQDGTVGTGRMMGIGKFLSPITDPDVEVYLLDETSARNIAIRMTWDEVKDFYAKRSKGIE